MSIAISEGKKEGTVENDLSAISSTLSTIHADSGSNLSSLFEIKAIKAQLKGAGALNGAKQDRALSEIFDVSYLVEYLDDSSFLPESRDFASYTKHLIYSSAKSISGSP